MTLLAKLLQTERPIIVRDGGWDDLRATGRWGRESVQERREDEIVRKIVREPIAFLKAGKKK